MPQLSDAELRTSFQRKPGGVFFLHGTEDFLKEEALRELIDAHVDPSVRDFNFDQLDGAAVSAEALASVLATPPMMAEWRVVVVREAQGLSNKAREVVSTTAAKPPAGLALLVSATIPSGSQAKFYTQLRKDARSIEFAAVNPHDAPGWLIERASTVHGVDLHPDAARALVSAMGSDLGMLTAELTKAVAYVQDREEITRDDIVAVSGFLPRVDRWAWFDRVGERDFGEAIRELPDLLSSGENGVGIIIGITTHFLRLALVAAGGTKTLEKELKPYQRWLARKIAPQARRWSPEGLDQALEELLRADHLLKSASLSDRHVIEELLLRLQQIASTERPAA